MTLGRRWKAVVVAITVCAGFLAMMCIFMKCGPRSKPEAGQDGLSDVMQKSAGECVPERVEAAEEGRESQLQVLVLDDSGAPLCGATVEFSGLGEDAGDRKIRVARTNVNGFVSFALRLQRIFHLLVYSDGFVSSRGAVSRERHEESDFRLKMLGHPRGVNVVEIDGEQAVRFALQREAILHGHVIDTRGVPCYGLQVAVVPIKAITSHTGREGNTRSFQKILGAASNTVEEYDRSALERWVTGDREAVFSSMPNSATSEVAYAVVEALRGFSVFTEDFLDVPRRLKVLTTDDKGDFEARNIRPQEALKVTIFGSTRSGERIVPLEEELTLEKAGQQNADFEVEMGCTLVCTLRLPQGSWGEEKRCGAGWTLRFMEDDALNTYGGECRQVVDEGKFAIGPFLVFGKAWLGAKVVRYFGEKGRERECLIGETEIPELVPGLNEVTVALQRRSNHAKSAGDVTIAVVDEQARRIQSGAFSDSVRAWVRDKGGERMLSSKRRSSHTHEEMKANDEGEFAVRISGNGPYDIGVLIGGAFHEERGVPLEPGDIYEFICPEEKRAGRGAIEIRVRDERGMPFDRVAVAIMPYGIDVSLEGWEGRSDMSMGFLKEGNYRVKAFVLPSPRRSDRRVAIERDVAVRPGVTERVDIGVSPCKRVSGRLFGGPGEDVGLRVFLSGIADSGGVFDVVTESKKGGNFLFDKVPLGCFTLRAAAEVGVFGPTDISVRNDQDSYEVELRMGEKSLPVTFMTEGPQGPNEGGEAWLKSVEVRSEEDGGLCGEFRVDARMTVRHKLAGTRPEQCVLHLARGSYRVAYCIDRMAYLKAEDTWRDVYHSMDFPSSVRETQIVVSDENNVFALR